jgi:ABC-2 type transport system ATP-binding protein
VSLAAPARDGQPGPENRPGAALSPPMLVLQQVHARDAAGPQGRARGSITEVSAALGQGIHVVLGTPDDGTLALLEVVTGVRPPLRGKVRIHGSDPVETPSVRARLGALAAEPRLPPAPSVGASIRLALRARGEVGHRFDAVLDPLGLSALHARSVRKLSFAEARAVELAIALTTPAPLVIALHEPLSDVAVPNLHLIQRRLRELASAGTCVLCTTSSPADALTLADRVHVLHRGFLVREVGGDGRGLGYGGVRELIAWIAAPSTEADRSLHATSGEAARALAAAMSRASGVRGVSWEEGHPFASRVRVQGDSAETCADALIEAASETGVTIEAITQGAPDLAEVRATTDARMRGRAFPLHGAPLPVAPVAAPSATPIPSVTPSSVPSGPSSTAPREARSAVSSLPAPPARSPVEDGGPLGRPKSVPAPSMDTNVEMPHAAPVAKGPQAASSAEPPRGPILPAPPPLPTIAEPRADSGPENGPSDPATPPSPTVNEGER